MLKDESKIIFHSYLKLYILDLNDITQPPVKIHQSFGSFTRIISGFEKDREVPILCDRNEAILVDTLTAKVSIA